MRQQIPALTEEAAGSPAFAFGAVDTAQPPQAAPDLHQAAERIRLALLAAIVARIRGWNMAQAEIASRLGTNRIRVNRLLKERWAHISIEAALGFAQAAGLEIEISVRDVVTEALVVQILAGADRSGAAGVALASDLVPAG